MLNNDSGLVILLIYAMSKEASQLLDLTLVVIVAGWPLGQSVARKDNKSNGYFAAFKII